jgi:uncharacterized protein
MISYKKKQNFYAEHDNAEFNYQRLADLLVNWDHTDNWLFDTVGKTNEMYCEISVVKRHVYTLDLNIKLHYSILDQSSSFIVRIYLDAKLAEVINEENCKLLQSKYDYPNKKMNTRDEKLQRNMFLSELLELLEVGCRVH